MSFVMQEVIEDMENIIVNWNGLPCILLSQTKMPERAAGRKCTIQNCNPAKGLFQQVQIQISLLTEVENFGLN